MILPLYVLRKYNELFVEGKYKCIRTAKSWYVLDYSDINGQSPSYADRRMSLLRDYLPYKLYPIDKVITEINQLVSNKYRSFYSDTGKVVKWKKSKYYPVKDYLITESWRTERGTWCLQVRNVGIVPVDNYQGQNIAKMVELGKQRLLYSIVDEKDLSPRRVML